MRIRPFVCLFLCGLFASGIAPNAAAQDPAGPDARRAPNLFASVIGVLNSNRATCLINTTGELCSDLSPVLGGGFWPDPTGQYIFGSGLQLAALISSSAGFAWAGDTVGAYAFDTRGTQFHTDALTPLVNSNDSTDLTNWPISAFVNDTSAFHPLYIGRTTASDQDLWGRYWDGNPAFLSGRTHPMGIVVEQRALAWNYPEWNRDVIYFVFRVTNVTARNPVVYADPELAPLGARFQDSSEARFGVAIPDNGYTLDSVFYSLTMDPDVGDAGRNHATTVLPFGLALAYKFDFSEPSWVFPPEVFGQRPFTAAPGFVGVRVLRQPGSLRLFSEFTGSPVGFPEPTGVRQLWRYLSGHLGAADMPCTVANPVVRQFCFVSNTDRDVRFMLTNGPMTLAPGESKTLVVAYLFAAALDTVLAYGSPSGLPPGIPFAGDSIAADPTKIRAIERAAGWLGQADTNSNAAIDANEVTTAARSLLHKAQLAQALADAKFLLPQPPAAPRFFLIPGDKRVTVVWQPSASETVGDPYFPIASDRRSALYDPNFRRYDVEGYRIYRGSRPDRLSLVAQFDYDGTQFRDYTGNLAYNGRCAPEIGVIDDCPVPFGQTPDSTVFVDRDLRSQVIQVQPGGRIESTNGAIVTLVADTVGGVGGTPSLSNTGVRFSYVDSTVGNAYTYFYAVTAFDLNSVRSGPASFESAISAQPATPRSGSGQEVAGHAPVMTLLGQDGTVLDPGAPSPAINPLSGVFAGPLPPTNGLTVALDAFLPELLGTDTVTVTIDSITAGSGLGGVPTVYHLRALGSAGARAIQVPVSMHPFSSDRLAAGQVRVVAASTGQSSRFGGDSTFVVPATITINVPGVWRLASWGRASLNVDPSNSDHNGPRWWTGAPNENTFAPNELQCTPSSGTCVQPDLSRNSGALSGVDILFHVQAYSTVPNTPMRELESIAATVTRAADFRVHWGANGALDSVVDRTHHVRVPFRPDIGASWGVLSDSSFIVAGTIAANTPDGRNDVLTWTDVLCVARAPTIPTGCVPGFAPQLLNRARLSAVSARSSTVANAAALPATGQGFVFYLNGHFFLMQLGSLPPAGTEWNARFYSGTITGTAAAGNYAFVPAIRPPAVPGLRARLTFSGSTLDLVRTNDSLLARVHTVPDPYYGASAFETVADSQRIAFVNLPARAVIRIYSVSGILVAILSHNDITGGGEEYWNLRSRTGKAVASGVYFYHIETPDRHSKIGRFTIINAFAR